MSQCTASTSIQAIGTLTLDYTYSENGNLLNRLASAVESGGTSEWSQYFGYDSYGNGWVSSSTGVPFNSFTPTVSTVKGGVERFHCGGVKGDHAVVTGSGEHSGAGWWAGRIKRFC